MSDFVYSGNKTAIGKLTESIQSIYKEDIPRVQEYHGDWGSLGVSENLYNGFRPFEDDTYICIVTGGPVLYFQDNLFLNNGGNNEGSKAILQRWMDKRIKWDEDLSGPFVIFIINKKTAIITCVTDLMSFIPVYAFQHSGEHIISTHVDVLGSVSGQLHAQDIVSKVDFILHGIITYPYTAYRRITQLQPSSVHSTESEKNQLSSNSYWLPQESLVYTSISEAAKDLRDSMEDYVSRITEGMPIIAQFISGGEDSRAISGLLPQKIKRDAFIFLDSFNREGRRAQKAAAAYDSNFIVSTRSDTHYMDILPAGADLVGTGAEYVHAHTLKFSKSCGLVAYPAVFGGLYSDDILKGNSISKIFESLKLPFLPEVKSWQRAREKRINKNLFNDEVLEELTRRRTAHLNLVRSFRKFSAEEWFELWPSSMNWVLPTHHANRRLFRSYEPFMGNGVVKVSAAVPQRWRLNRRLFLAATKPYLRQTKWLFHSDGRLPYFPWYLNNFIQFWVWSYQQAVTRSGLVKGFQGPWGDWDTIMKSREYQKLIELYGKGIWEMRFAFEEKNFRNIFKSKKLTRMQRINLLQTMYSNQKIMEAEGHASQRNSQSVAAFSFDASDHR